MFDFRSLALLREYVLCFCPAHLVNLHVLNYSGFLSFHCSLELAVDVNKSRSCIINLHRVSLLRPTVPIQCKLSFIMFIALRFKSLFSFIFLQFVS